VFVCDEDIVVGLEAGGGGAGGTEHVKVLLERVGMNENRREGVKDWRGQMKKGR
jgi:hypothetical protein